MFEKKYKIIFIRKQFNAYFVARIIQTNDIKKTIALTGKQFGISIENPLYISKMQKVYCLDFDSGSQLTFNEAKAFMTPEELDLIVGQKIIKELTSGVIDNKKEKLAMILLGLIMGALIAALVLMMYYTDKIQNMLEDYAEEEPTIIVAIKRTYQIYKC
jgi:hypothetical protein